MLTTERGSGHAWVPPDASGFNLPTPFDVPSFGRVNSPNIARVWPFRDFALSAQAANVNNGGTHVWLRLFHPTTLALVTEFSAFEFLVQDGYHLGYWGAHGDSAVPASYFSMPYLLGIGFDNLDPAVTTVTHFDGVFCSS
jgi:hypothetical protein